MKKEPNQQPEPMRMDDNPTILTSPATHGSSMDVSQKKGTPIMNMDSFARFFVRFNGLCFLFWALHDSLDFPVMFQHLKLTQSLAFSENLVAHEFYLYVAKLCLQLLGAVILLGRTDKLITLILTGKWRMPTKDKERG